MNPPSAGTKQRSATDPACITLGCLIDVLSPLRRCAGYDGFGLHRSKRNSRLNWTRAQCSFSCMSKLRLPVQHIALARPAHRPPRSWAHRLRAKSAVTVLRSCRHTAGSVPCASPAPAASEIDEWLLIDCTRPKTRRLSNHMSVPRRCPLPGSRYIATSRRPPPEPCMRCSRQRV